MKPIPIENDLEISFELCEIDNLQETKVRIDKIREKIKNLQSEGEKNMILNLCEILVESVEKWEDKDSMSLLNKAIHCVQKANIFLARQKQKIFDVKRKDSKK